VVTGNDVTTEGNQNQMILSSADAKVKGFMTQASASQRAIIGSINCDDPLMAAFAQADARRAIICAASKEIKVYLAAIADPRIGMVEVVDATDGRPHDESIADVMCIAFMNGFVPGRDQFSVFGKRDRTAQLYVKKAGYDLWFARLENCSVPVVQHEHPHFKKFGTSDKNVWVVEGFAECVYRGTTYTVTRTGKQAIGIPGYPSDQIANVSTKTKRALLKSLWQLVSAYTLDSVDDGDDSDAATVVVTSPKQVIEAAPAASETASTYADPAAGVSSRETITAAFDSTLKDISKRLSKDPSAVSMYNELWTAVGKCTTHEELQKAADGIKPANKIFATRDMDALRRWYVFCQSGIVQETKGDVSV